MFQLTRIRGDRLAAAIILVILVTYIAAHLWWVMDRFILILYNVSGPLAQVLKGMNI